MSKYIEFKKASNYPQDSKLQYWYIINKKSGNSIGMIYWYSNWRKYCFEPHPETVWDVGCLLDIVEFLNKLKEEE
ncbi:MAG: hypothetical protein M1365_12560 [Actinobacteria bacterium]|nr:hypothetical protein [Actinomycetota bacterium]